MSLETSIISADIFRKCQRCSERPGSIICRECKQKGEFEVLCYTCNRTVHQNSQHNYEYATFNEMLLTDREGLLEHESGIDSTLNNSDYDNDSVNMYFDDKENFYNPKIQQINVFNSREKSSKNDRFDDSLPIESGRFVKISKKEIVSAYNNNKEADHHKEAFRKPLQQLNMVNSIDKNYETFGRPIDEEKILNYHDEDIVIKEETLDIKGRYYDSRGFKEVEESFKMQGVINVQELMKKKNDYPGTDVNELEEENFYPSNQSLGNKRQKRNSIRNRDSVEKYRNRKKGGESTGYFGSNQQDVNPAYNSKDEEFYKQRAREQSKEARTPEKKIVLYERKNSLGNLSSGSNGTNRTHVSKNDYIQASAKRNSHSLSRKENEGPRVVQCARRKRNSNTKLRKPPLEKSFRSENQRRISKSRDEDISPPQKFDSGKVDEEYEKYKQERDREKQQQQRGCEEIEQEEMLKDPANRLYVESLVELHQTELNSVKTKHSLEIERLEAQNSRLMVENKEKVMMLEEGILRMEREKNGLREKFGDYERVIKNLRAQNRLLKEENELLRINEDGVSGRGAAFRDEIEKIEILHDQNLKKLRSKHIEEMTNIRNEYERHLNEQLSSISDKLASKDSVIRCKDEIIKNQDKEIEMLKRALQSTKE